MVENTIKQGLIFNVLEKFHELLDKMRGILVTREEKVYNFISDPFET